MCTHLVRALAIVLTIGASLAACTRAPAISLAEPERISATTTVGAAPMFAVAPGGMESAAWVSAPGGGDDGRLYISVGGAPPVELQDTLGGIEAHGEAPPKLAYGPDGSLSALYVVARLVPGRRFPAAALRFSRSADGGATWSPPATVTDDSVFGSHNFHALHIAGDGTIYVAWLDGRLGKSTAFITRSTDGGRTWSANRQIDANEACPCCRTAIATARDGTVYAAWRTVMAGNIRDIVVARSTDRGETWSAPVRAHADEWFYEGCPHAGPSMLIDDADRLHVGWWTGKPGAAGAYYARSIDGGTTFSKPIALGVAESSRPAHVQLALSGRRLVAAWDDGTVRVPRVVLRLSHDGGATFGDPILASGGDRAATFPVVALTGDAVVVAWSEEPAATHAHAEASRPDMSAPNAVMGLKTVGDRQVIVRRGTIR